MYYQRKGRSIHGIEDLYAAKKQGKMFLICCFMIAGTLAYLLADVMVGISTFTLLPTGLLIWLVLKARRHWLNMRELER